MVVGHLEGLAFRVKHRLNCSMKYDMDFCDEFVCSSKKGNIYYSMMIDLPSFYLY